MNPFTPDLRSQASYLFKAGFDAISHHPTRQVALLSGLLDKLEGLNVVLQKFAIDFAARCIANLPADHADDTHAATKLVTSASAMLVAHARSTQQLAAPLQARASALVTDSANRFDAGCNYRDGICQAMVRGAIGAPRIDDAVREAALTWTCAQLSALLPLSRKTALFDLVADSVLLDPAKRRTVCAIAIDELTDCASDAELLRVLILVSPQLDAEQRHRILAYCHPVITALSSQTEAQGTLAVTVINSLPLVSC